jgi:hypothetical protein
MPDQDCEWPDRTYRGADGCHSEDRDHEGGLSTFRYCLERRWSDEPGFVLWVMFNPSIATDQVGEDDPAVRFCIKRSKLLSKKSQAFALGRCASSTYSRAEVRPLTIGRKEKRSSTVPSTSGTGTMPIFRVNPSGRSEQSLPGVLR